MLRKPPPVALVGSPDELEAQFYEALQQGKLDLMMACWADDEEIVCVHPGGARLVGPLAVRAGFEAIFAQGGVPATPEQVHRLQALGCAVHHLTEHIRVLTPEGAQSGWTHATNVYVKTAEGWRMVAHHASPAAQPEQGQQSPMAQGAGPGSVLH